MQRGDEQRHNLAVLHGLLQMGHSQQQLMRTMRKLLHSRQLVAQEAHNRSWDLGCLLALDPAELGQIPNGDSYQRVFYTI